MPTEQTDTTQTPPEEITYTPTVWADGADGGTPINAANLNNMEEAIVALVERTTKQVVTSMIADGAVTNAKLDQTLRDSLSQFSAGGIVKNVKVQGNGNVELWLFCSGKTRVLSIADEQMLWLDGSTGAVIGRLGFLK